MLTDMGNEIKVVRAIAPQSSGAQTVNGSSVDRSGFYSAILFVDVGAISGSPTATAIDCKIQESDDGSTWADVSGATIATISGANTQRELNINLEGRKRYIRAVATIVFTGGTSPSALISASFVLGGSISRPI